MVINSISTSFPAAIPARPAALNGSINRTEHTGVMEGSGYSPPNTSELSVTGSTQAPSREQVDEAMEKMRDALPLVARNLQFSGDEETGRSVVKVVDATTDEVIRQMPSEELLNIAKTLDKLSGLLLKQKA